MARLITASTVYIGAMVDFPQTNADTAKQSYHQIRVRGPTLKGLCAIDVQLES
jgi:hypothetical protein